MKNENLNEYEQILNEMEALQSEFNVLLAKKKSLRFAYKNDKLKTLVLLLSILGCQIQ